ncbi:hypothetical protein GIB67_017978 [Kingdonia uniflora]|uniref:RING-type E3 ubiquitin transferase n=1 Tax=Kingdonia uniflora TaxID=39325 RepID=A0A7J7NWX9_9MAGN|nr:hypothetical protein GIB67_017978 [Kingdonia uniflora]
MPTVYNGDIYDDDVYIPFEAGSLILEESETDEDDEDETDAEDEVYVPPDVVDDATNDNPSSSNPVEVIEVGTQGNRCSEGEASTSSSSSRRVAGEGAIESSNDNTEGLCCPICMEPWTSEGAHQVSCLPCGHLYGLSCIHKWLRQKRRNSGKCPQCGRYCSVNKIIKVYAPRVVAADGEQQKILLSLQAENEVLKMKIANLHEKLLQDKEEKMRKEKEAVDCTENASFREVLRQSESTAWTGGSHGHVLNGYTVGSNFGYQRSSCDLTLETEVDSPLFDSILKNKACDGRSGNDELTLDGARIFDMDASSRILILARRLSGMAGTHVLTKISLIYPYESENIHLPPNTKAVRDLRVSPRSDRLALVASIGKKLSVVSMESNNIVLTYDLPGPAWSCSWDRNNPHHLNTGLQNGKLLVFDMRQTACPMESINGLTSHPVHTIHSLKHDNSLPIGVRTLLTASSIGPCVWKTGGTGERPFLVPEVENQGVCISLAYCPFSGDIVSSFRPRVEMSNDTVGSQPPHLFSPTVSGQGVYGSHVHIKKTGDCYQRLGSTIAKVNDVRLPKSAIINVENCNPIFAYEDEGTHRLSLRELPSLRVSQNLEHHQHPILDVKYAAHSSGIGLLGCISESKLQLFSAKSS